MGVRAGGAPGGPDPAQLLAAAYLIADRNIDPGKVAVAAGDAVAVIDLDHIAIAALASGLEDRAASGRIGDLALLAIDVHPGMELITAGAERVAAKTEFIIYLA